MSSILCHRACCKNTVETVGAMYCSECAKQIRITVNRRPPPVRPDSGSVNIQMQYWIEFGEYWKQEAEMWERESERWQREATRRSNP
jgi:hypothetical protein